MCSNDTLGNTSSNWTSNYIVTSFKVFSVLSMFLTGVLEERGGGGGGNRLPV